MNKKPQDHPAGDDLLRKIEVKRKRNIIVDKFFPALKEASVSVDESKMLIQSMSSFLMEGVLKTMQERKFDEIIPSMLERLCKDGERKEEVQKLLSVLEGENLFVAREIIEGITRAIDQMVLDEMRNRKLETLSADWDRMLN